MAKQKTEVHTQFFFDRIHKGIDKASKTALSRFGAFVRQRDKTSIKYETKRKQKSLPGEPPIAHRAGRFTREKTNKKTGVKTRRAVSPLRELIFFSYDPSRRSVVVGPAIFNSARVGGGVAPRVIEEGGVSRIFSGGKRRVARFQARPHLLPAFQAELPKAAGLFRNTFGR